MIEDLMREIVEYSLVLNSYVVRYDVLAEDIQRQLSIELLVRDPSELPEKRKSAAAKLQEKMSEDGILVSQLVKMEMPYGYRSPWSKP